MTIWSPDIMPNPLFKIPLEDIPGVGRRMLRKLAVSRIVSTEDLYNAQPKQLRSIRRNVTGEQLWLKLKTLPQVHDDQALLSALAILWEEMSGQVPSRTKAMRVGVTLCDLSPADARQLDMLLDDDKDRQKWERTGEAIDALNTRFGRTVASLGDWKPPVGGNVGGKISFTRIPSAEDFL